MTPEWIGRYRILRPLGAGGMGEVYLGEDPALNRRVAIKVLPAASGFDATAIARLLREAQAAATLDHPHVCSVYEVGEHDGAPFIAMQHIEGETLARRLARGPLTIADAVPSRNKSPTRWRLRMRQASFTATSNPATSC